MNILKNATAPPQASGTTLGFARGNVGFLALGDLGKDFNTGLPVIDHIIITMSSTVDIQATLLFSCLRGRSHITSAAGRGRGGKPNADHC